MNDKLDWLKDNMPEGSKLYFETNNPDFPEGYWEMHFDPDRCYTLHLEDGDIGLAPLTALLKQELRAIEHHVIHMLPGSDNGRFQIDRIYYINNAEPVSKGDTEFEAVFEAYKESISQ